MSSAENNSDFGLPGVRHIRQVVGLTQDELSEKLNITTRWLSDVENGKRDCGMALQRRIAKVLCCELADLFRRPTKDRLSILAAKYTSEAGKAADAFLASKEAGAA